MIFLRSKPFLRPANFCRGFAFFLLITGAWTCRGKDQGEKTGIPTHHADITYENGEGKSRTVTLPDGSKVEMTPHTVVRISKEFNKSERDLELDGEALFTVGTDVGKPFVVHTKNLQIQVLSGGQFKVEAFEKNAGEEADLLSGKLQVKKSYHSDTDNEPEILEAGQMVMINRDIDLMEKEKLDSAELKSLQERFQVLK